MPKVNKPQQARSQKTMNRILDAAELLLEEKSFGELSIQEIVGAAGSSVGSFYARFQDKEGLLQALDERYFESLISLTESAIESVPWPSISLAEVVTELTRLVVTLHSQKQGVQRTLILAAKQNPDPRFREREAHLWELIPQLLTHIAAYESEIAHRPAGPAIHFAFMQMYYTAREMLIWPHLRDNMPFQDELLITALARSFLSYLRHDPYRSD